jgi:hypothetical protein
MNRYFIFLLISSFPILTFSQTYISADSANKLIMNGGDCSDRTYIKVEILPSLKISKQTFIDSISTYFKLKGESFENGKVILGFIVNCHSKISDMDKIAGDIGDVTTLEAAILNFSDFWLPARQSNYIVSSHLSLEMLFKNNMLSNIIISQ